MTDLVSSLANVSAGMLIGYFIGYYEYPLNEKIKKVRQRRAHFHDNT